MGTSPLASSSLRLVCQALAIHGTVYEPHSHLIDEDTRHRRLRPQSRTFLSTVPAPNPGITQLSLWSGMGWKAWHLPAGKAGLKVWRTDVTCLLRPASLDLWAQSWRLGQNHQKLTQQQQSPALSQWSPSVLPFPEHLLVPCSGGTLCYRRPCHKVPQHTWLATLPLKPVLRLGWIQASPTSFPPATLGGRGQLSSCVHRQGWPRPLTGNLH